MDTSTTVAYIGGCGRSGSTLLARLLAVRAGVVACGELVFLWRRGLVEDQLCGCGAPFSTCTFWSAVGERAFDGWAAVDGKRLADTEFALTRRRRRAPTPTDLDHLAEHVRSLYAAIAVEGGATIIVDASKDYSYFRFLSSRLDMPVTPIHLVRDVRGVVHSWRRRKPDKADSTGFMPTINPLTQTLLWSYENLRYSAHLWSHPTGVSIRYEDLVADVDRQLARIADALGAPWLTTAAAVSERPATDQHLVAANPMRFERRVDVRPDDAWHSQLPAWLARSVTAATYPLLRHYGYELHVPK